MLSTDKHNHSCLEIVDNALFIVCLDDTSPQNLADLCHNFLCGTYELEGGEQVGTCTNRWYDKVSTIYAHPFSDFVLTACIFYSFKLSFVLMVQPVSISSTLVLMVTQC